MNEYTPTLPAAEVYQEWLDNRRSTKAKRGLSKLDGRRLRRAVMLKRKGDLWSDIAIACWSSPGWLKQLYAELPSHLK